MSKHREALYARSRARRLAMQAGYQWQMGGHDVAEVIEQFVSEASYAQVDDDYFRALVQASTATALDSKLEECMDYSMDKADTIERSILRSAAYEIACVADVDFAVAINEAVILAKKYCAVGSFRFINGVLDCFAKKYASERDDAKKYASGRDSETKASPFHSITGDDAKKYASGCDDETKANPLHSITGDDAKKYASGCDSETKASPLHSITGDDAKKYASGCDSETKASLLHSITGDDAKKYASGCDDETKASPLHSITGDDAKKYASGCDDETKASPFHSITRDDAKKYASGCDDETKANPLHSITRGDAKKYASGCDSETKASPLHSITGDDAKKYTSGRDSETKASPLHSITGDDAKKYASGCDSETKASPLHSITGDDAKKYASGRDDEAKASPLHSMDEERLIRRYFYRHQSDADLNSDTGFNVCLGIGDDAAVIGVHGERLAITVDTLVEDVHFKKGCDAKSVGHKALAVNLSDLAAMGAQPRWALLALTIPSADADWLQAFSDGFFQLATRHRVRLIGGDTTRGRLTITVQLIGTLSAAQILRRNRAQADEGIYVTGRVADTALAMLYADSLKAYPQSYAQCTERMLRPVARVAEGRILARYATAAIDISDGLFKDVSRLVYAADVGGEIDIEQIPTRAEVRNYCPTLESLLKVLSYGEDYELLFTMKDIHYDALKCAFSDLGTPFTRIGTVTKARTLKCRWQTQSFTLANPPGYDHFS